MPLSHRLDALRRLIRTLLVGGLCLFLLPGLWSAEAMRRAFDLPAGGAEPVLKLLSQQGGVQLLFDSRLVKNVQVNAVRGDFTSLEAARDCSTTPPSPARPDESSGILGIEREPKPSAPSEKRPRRALTLRQPRAPRPCPARTRHAQPLHPKPNP